MLLTHAPLLAPAPFVQRLAESSGSSLGYGAASGSSKKEAEDGAAAGAAAAGSNGTGEAAPSLA